MKSDYYSLPPQQIEKYHREGYIIVPDVLTSLEVAALVDRIDGLLEGRYSHDDDLKVGSGSNNSADDPGRLIKQVMPMKYPISDPILRASAIHERVRSIAAQLMGVEDAVLFQMQALIKDPGQENGTPPHQDDFYWNSGQAVTAWVPLEPLFADSGTMWVVPGSHRGEVLGHQRADGVSQFHTIDADLDPSTVVPLLMDVGSVSFHHSKTIHGAWGNKGSVRRIALAQHYRPANAGV